MHHCGARRKAKNQGLHQSVSVLVDTCRLTCSCVCVCNRALHLQEANPLFTHDRSSFLSLAKTLEACMRASTAPIVGATSDEIAAALPSVFPVVAPVEDNIYEWTIRYPARLFPPGCKMNAGLKQTTYG